MTREIRRASRWRRGSQANGDVRATPMPAVLSDSDSVKGSLHHSDGPECSGRFRSAANGYAVGWRAARAALLRLGENPAFIAGALSM